MKDRPSGKVDYDRYVPQSQFRLTRRGRLVTTITVPVLLLLLYTLVVGVTPLPHLQPELTSEATAAAAGSDELITAAVAQTGKPQAVAWAEGGKITQQWKSTDEKIPMASITKVVTALAGLEKQPVEAGTDGATYTVTEEDVNLLQDVWAQNGTWEDAIPGQELTTRQLFDLILLTSANNYALSYATWVFGDNATYVKEANAWLKANGMNDTIVYEPSGLDERNTSTVGDLLKLGAIAVNDPFLSDVIDDATAEIPEIGEIENTNTLVRKGNAIGVKTGMTESVGYNLLAAAEQVRDDRTFTMIAVALVSDEVSERNERTRDLLDAARATTDWQTLLEPKTTVGHVVTWDGQRVDLVTTNEKNRSSSLLPDEQAKMTTEVDEITGGYSGGKVGTVTISDPAGKRHVSVVPAGTIADPGFGWRFTHPGIVLGFTHPKESTDAAAH